MSSFLVSSPGRFFRAASHFGSTRDFIWEVFRRFRCNDEQEATKHPTAHPAEEDVYYLIGT